jgi:ferredoxin
MPPDPRTVARRAVAACPVLALRLDAAKRDAAARG